MNWDAQTSVFVARLSHNGGAKTDIVGGLGRTRHSLLWWLQAPVASRGRSPATQSSSRALLNPIQRQASEVARAMVRSNELKGGLYGTDEENSRGSGRALLAVHSWRDQSS